MTEKIMQMSVLPVTVFRNGVQVVDSWCVVATLTWVGQLAAEDRIESEKQALDLLQADRQLCKKKPYRYGCSKWVSCWIDLARFTRESRAMDYIRKAAPFYQSDGWAANSAVWLHTKDAMKQVMAPRYVDPVPRLSDKLEELQTYRKRDRKMRERQADPVKLQAYIRHLSRRLEKLNSVRANNIEKAAP